MQRSGTAWRCYSSLPHTDQAAALLKRSACRHASNACHSPPEPEMTQQTRMTEHGKTPSLPLAPTAGVHRHACISTNRHTTRLPSASPQTLHDIGTSAAASRAARASVPNDRCVMAMSSTRMLNSLARAVRLSRTCARARRAGRGQDPESKGGGQRARSWSCQTLTLVMEAVQRVLPNPNPDHGSCAAGGCAGVSTLVTAGEIAASWQRRPGCTHAVRARGTNVRDLHAHAHIVPEPCTSLPCCTYKESQLQAITRRLAQRKTRRHAALTTAQRRGAGSHEGLRDCTADGRGSLQRRRAPRGRRGRAASAAAPRCTARRRPSGSRCRWRAAPARPSPGPGSAACTILLL